jgi:filamentous hemagglutinin family protein
MKKHIFLFLTTALSIVPNISHAQTYTPSNRKPQTDNSIGTIVTPTGNNFDITGGLQRGQNLFHSFSDFSIPTGSAANFINPQQPQSIITRVTGNMFSDINGTLNTNGANFLLINPRGVVFGTNAQLNVGKAFVTSTASGVDFVDAQGQNYNFGVNQQGDPLLSVAPDVAFNPARLVMNVSIPGSKGIENYGTLQTNNAGQYVGLIGGDVNFYGGQIIAPGAKVELGGLVQSGTVGFSLENGVQIPANVERGNVSLVSIGTSPSNINVQAGGGGSVGIFAKDIRLQGTGTYISSGIAPGLGSPTAIAGDIKLEATSNITLSESNIFNQVAAGGVGKGGNIEITTNNLAVTNGAQLVPRTEGQGDAGSVKITATGDISFDNGYASSTVEPGAVGKGGNIEINTRNLAVTNGAQLQASTRGQGDAGSIKITATDGDILFDGRKDGFSSAALSTVEQGAVGKGGGIEINTRNLTVTNGAQLNVNTRGQGDAGSIKITATDGDILFDGGQASFRSAAFSRVEPGAVGKGGTIEINTRNLAVTNGAALSASTLGQGDAGSIKITATGGDILFDGSKDGFRSAASSTVRQGGVGKGGNIEINTRNLAVTNDAVLVASTEGQGDAGSIKITATGGDILFDNNSFALSTVERGAVGKGGNIEINTRNLAVTNIAQLQALTRGQGDAGSIKITATGDILFDGRKDAVRSAALSTVEQGAVGKGGGLEINARNLAVTNGAALATSSLGQGDAGNIFLNVNTIRLNQGRILSRATSSIGGDINITTKNYLLLRNGSRISTDSDSTGKDGNGGNITISSPLIIATPGNNDITANANQGNGGRVNITSQGLFGIQYRPTGSSFTSDITASSTFGQSGNVQINTPGVDPGKDTGKLPAAPNDASRQISQTCSARQRDNKFYITGRGGLPPNASEPQESEALWQDAREVKHKPATTANKPAQLAPPAIGWVFEQNGRVRLIAAQTAGVPTGTRVVCPGK